ncbi:MAG: hypothetical protein M1814_004392 [Vezdaea aestivalis]|nr:MAG: hypothetical protein M1814_004392 [Vezdaea aestivalis]
MAAPSSTPPVVPFQSASVNQPVELSKTDAQPARSKAASKSHSLRKVRKPKENSLQHWAGWEKDHRSPYHEYVHSLVTRGWTSLKLLDESLNTDLQHNDLIISVLDITSTHQLVRHPDLHSEASLKAFLSSQPRTNVKVRLYLAEQAGSIASGVVEALGSSLKLDPRFFQWNLFGNARHLLSPAEQNRAPFTSICFQVLRNSKSHSLRFEEMWVSIYVQPDEDLESNGWTGVLIFDSHVKSGISVENLVTPPRYEDGVVATLSSVDTKAASAGGALPQEHTFQEHTFRELYLSSFKYVTASLAVASPFYALHYLFKLNGASWNAALSVLRARDKECREISSTNVGQVIEIQWTLDIIERRGSRGWRRPVDERDDLVKENHQMLQEDFESLIREAKDLWETRRQMADIRKQRREARVSALTNAFTFGFAPISLVTGLFSMGVVQLSGNKANPSIWIFFVVLVGLNLGILTCLVVGEWVAVRQRQTRKPGIKEVMMFALGRR